MRSPLVALRAARPEDDEFLYAVYASTRAPELAVLGWDEAAMDVFLRMQFELQDRWHKEQTPAACFDVVLVDGAPAGRLYVDRRPDEIRIVDIALLSEHRRKGVGTTLLNELLAEADAAGKPVTIHVERFNPALRFYERLGFSLAEDRGVYLYLERKPARAT